MTEFEDQTRSDAPPAVPLPATVSQTVSSNAGSVIGVRTDVIHGNVYGNTVSEVQVLVFGGGGGPELWRQLLDAPTPYPWPRPYGVRDRARFCGRTAETEQVLRQLTEGRVLILYGPAGMGKTSLLCAGVMPRLLEAGALVVRVQDYLRPLSETLRGSLQESHEQLPLELPAGAALPSLVRAVQAQTGGTLVLVLDQFERLFDPEVPAQERAAFADDLGQVLRTAPGMDVRVIVAVREDALGSALRWGNLSSAQNALPLGPLDPLRAGEAVESPLELTVAGRTAFEVVYDADTLNERLLPDLRAMSPDPRGVYPPHLQIVCSELFEEARRRGRPIVDADLYRSVGHAEGVVARYLQRKLNEQFPEERGRQVAWRVLTDLASAEPASWLGLDSFDHGEVPREQLVNTLSRLLEWGLLTGRGLNGQRQYTFTSPAVRKQAELHAGPGFKVEQERERVWAAWLSRRALPPWDAVRFLTTSGPTLPPLQALLLLRAAVASDAPPGRWLTRLLRPDGAALIDELENPGARQRTAAEMPDHSSLEEARTLLWMEGEPGAAPLPVGGEGFGPVAATAVSTPDPITRQMAALTLTLLSGFDGPDHLRRALSTLRAGLPRWNRTGEVLSTILDAGPPGKFAQLLAEFPLPARLSVGVWRVWRRVKRDRRCLAALTAGGFLGSGLGVALLRALWGMVVARMGVPVGPLGVLFSTAFFSAAPLGGALSLALGLASSLRPASFAEGTGDHPNSCEPLADGRGLFPLVLVLGTCLFETAHTLVAWSNGAGFFLPPVVIAMSVVAGAGLSASLFTLIQAGGGRRGGLTRLVGAGASFAVTAVLAQILNAEGLSLVYSPGTYASLLEHLHLTPGGHLALGLLDASLVGVLLALGVTVGMSLGRTLTSNLTRSPGSPAGLGT